MKISRTRFLGLAALALAGTFLAGCQSAYYSTMEKFGIEKRDILVDRVEEARDAQEDTKEQFANALEQFSALIDFDGGELEKLYSRLNSEFERSQESAERISERVDAVEQVAGDLFREWEQELEQYESASLRRESARQLDDTRDRYEELIARMRRAEDMIDPVLRKLQDQVLFLKHNLNARAVSSLENEAMDIQTDVRALIEEMEASIAEANSFIESMR